MKEGNRTGSAVGLDRVGANAGGARARKVALAAGLTLDAKARVAANANLRKAAARDECQASNDKGSY